MKKIKLLSITGALIAEKYPQWLSNLENRFLPSYVWRSDLLTRWRCWVYWEAISNQWAVSEDTRDTG